MFLRLAARLLGWHDKDFLIPWLIISLGAIGNKLDNASFPFDGIYNASKYKNVFEAIVVYPFVKSEVAHDLFEGSASMSDLWLCLYAPSWVFPAASETRLWRILLVGRWGTIRWQIMVRKRIMLSADRSPK